MEFYKRKTIAMAEISEAIGKSEIVYFKPLAFKILRKYGFGKNFLKNYLRDLEEMNICNYDEEAGTIKHIKLEKKKEKEKELSETEKEVIETATGG